MSLEHRAVGAFDYYFSAIAAKLTDGVESINNKDSRNAIIEKAKTMAREMVEARDKIVQLPGSPEPEPEPESK